MSLNHLPYHQNYVTLIGNCGRWTRRWRQILDRKQNSRYFCACALNKLPNHRENIYRWKSYSPIIENGRRLSECQGQIFLHEAPK